LVAVAKYCVELKGPSINWHYILQVARNLFANGKTTLASVEEHLNSQQKYDNDLRMVFKAMHTKRAIDHTDRELYERWVKDYGFSLDVIVAVAKRCTTGGIVKLNNLLGEYYSNRVLSLKEIESYETQREHLYELAKNINKTIGVYYQSLDMIVSQYLMDWQRKGYDDETLLAIAKYCFTVGVRTLNGLASTIEKLYKCGITTIIALDQYIEQLSARDQQIKQLLQKAGLDRLIYALGIRNIGEKAAKLLAAAFGNIDALANAAKESLVAIPDFGEITADCVIDYFSHPQTSELIEKLKAYGVVTSYEIEKTDTRFAGLTFVLTGTLPHLSRDEAAAIIERHGGKTSSSVSAKTSYVVAGEKAGSKLVKAQTLGVQVIDEEALLKMAEETL
jgi:hypothetical protein